MFLFIDKSLDAISSLIHNKIQYQHHSYFYQSRKDTSHPIKIGLEENFHQVLFLISLYIHVSLYLMSKKNELISNQINIPMTYDYFLQIPYTKIF